MRIQTASSAPSRQLRSTTSSVTPAAQGRSLRSGRQTVETSDQVRSLLLNQSLNQSFDQ